MIKLWGNLVMDADKDNYIVGELRNVNVKTDTGVIQAQRMFKTKYFTTFENALQYALETAIKRCVNNADYERAKSFAEEVKKAREEMKMAFSMLGLEESNNDRK